MRHTERPHQYANTSAQQQPRRPADRQQQQSSGSGDYQPRRWQPQPGQLGDAPDGAAQRSQRQGE